MVVSTKQKAMIKAERCPSKVNREPARGVTLTRCSTMLLVTEMYDTVTSLVHCAAETPAGKANEISP